MTPQDKKPSEYWEVRFVDGYGWQVNYHGPMMIEFRNSHYLVDKSHSEQLEKQLEIAYKQRDEYSTELVLARANEGKYKAQLKIAVEALEFYARGTDSLFLDYCEQTGAQIIDEENEESISEELGTKARDTLKLLRGEK